MIQINEKIRIRRLDKWNLQVEEYLLFEQRDSEHKFTGGKDYKWTGIGFYGDLKSALIGILKHELLHVASEQLTVEKLIDRITEIENNLIKAVEKRK